MGGYGKRAERADAGANWGLGGNNASSSSKTQSARCSCGTRGGSRFPVLCFYRNRPRWAEGFDQPYPPAFCGLLMGLACPLLPVLFRSQDEEHKEPYEGNELQQIHNPIYVKHFKAPPFAPIRRQGRHREAVSAREPVTTCPYRIWACASPMRRCTLTTHQFVHSGLMNTSGLSQSAGATHGLPEP